MIGTTPTRDTPEHRYNAPDSIDDLPHAERVGPVAMTVDLAKCPLSTLAAVGAALGVMASSGNVHPQREGALVSFRAELSAAEKNDRVRAARARYDLGADAYDKAVTGAELVAYEEMLLDQYLELSGLERPVVKADA